MSNKVEAPRAPAPEPTTNPEWNTVDHITHRGVGPRRTFAVARGGLVLSTHEGPGLTPEAVVATETSHVAHFDGTEELHCDVVWEGDVAVAMISYTGAKGAEVTYLGDRPGPDAPAEDPRPASSAGPRVVRHGGWDDRPQPLARLSTTFVYPRDPCPISLEMLVLLSDPAEGEHTAGSADLPELLQAGWFSYELGSLTIFSRVVS